MKKILPLFCVCGLLWIGCADEKKSTPAEASDTQTTKQVDKKTETTPAAKASPKTNPPHGEPGHRCGIPVGAPLDGSATQSGNNANLLNKDLYGNTGNTTQKANTTVQPRAKQQTAEGMQGKPNPPHGQAGHRCDVKVGEPLP
ncbi:hypothetical protein GGR32_000850 [Mesonia hippocampi]|uniref:Uncharacterized protein n=1 Tax=Mesonia hippocampi TaxID=1628250 RepID=A0A840ENM6_9FLAO|nr:hypothetical protein [Mesonia hippocampi]MBB4118570.1 hypothetical protein [Mesonia hippocampi]